MKILFGIQATGNGHITRSAEICKLLKENPEVSKVDILISGAGKNMEMPFEANYSFKGFSFSYGKKGRISVIKTFRKVSFLSVAEALLTVPFSTYDLIISDFEPITCWGAKIYGIPSIGIGNQYSLMSKKFPQKSARSKLTKLITRIMCPADEKLAMHFKKFDDFIYYPIIRNEVRSSISTCSNFTLVYLNSFNEEELVRFFTSPLLSNFRFVVYTPECEVDRVVGNVLLRKTNKDLFTNDLASCSGVITTAGFQTTSEALYLGKKLYVISIKRQFEQLSNAKILNELGVYTNKKLDHTHLLEWLRIASPIKVDFGNETGEIVQFILRKRKAA